MVRGRGAWSEEARWERFISGGGKMRIFDTNCVIIRFQLQMVLQKQYYKKDIGKHLTDPLYLFKAMVLRKLIETSPYYASV